MPFISHMPASRYDSIIEENKLLRKDSGLHYQDIKASNRRKAAAAAKARALGKKGVIDEEGSFITEEQFKQPGKDDLSRGGNNYSIEKEMTDRDKQRRDELVKEAGEGGSAEYNAMKNKLAGDIVGEQSPSEQSQKQQQEIQEETKNMKEFVTEHGSTPNLVEKYGDKITETMLKSPELPPKESGTAEGGGSGGTGTPTSERRSASTGGSFSSSANASANKSVNTRRGYNAGGFNQAIDQDPMTKTTTNTQGAFKDELKTSLADLYSNQMLQDITNTGTGTEGNIWGDMAASREKQLEKYNALIKEDGYQESLDGGQTRVTHQETGPSIDMVDDDSAAVAKGNSVQVQVQQNKSDGSGNRVQDGAGTMKLGHTHTELAGTWKNGRFYPGSVVNSSLLQSMFSDQERANAQIWTNDGKDPVKAINARIETLTNNGTWQNASITEMRGSGKDARYVIEGIDDAGDKFTGIMHYDKNNEKNKTGNNVLDLETWDGTGQTLQNITGSQAIYEGSAVSEAQGKVIGGSIGHGYVEDKNNVPSSNPSGHNR